MALALSGASPPPNPAVTLTTQTPNVGQVPPLPPPQGQQLAGGFPLPAVVAPGGGDVVVLATPVSTSMKKRGRPPGSGTKHLLLEAMGSAGFGFTPHVITVKAGEVVSEYRTRGMEFLLQTVNHPTYLEDLTGLTELKRAANFKMNGKPKYFTEVRCLQTDNKMDQRLFFVKLWVKGSDLC